MKKIQLFLVTLLVSCITAMAQDLSVTGKITQADDGSPLVGVTIKISGTSTVVLSDVDGNYVITIPSSARNKSLEISYIGFEPQTINVSRGGVHNVALKEDANLIDDVVIVGYGTPRRAGTTVGSSVKVDGAKIGSRASSSALDALQGQVPGLQIYTSSGNPGEVQSVRLHGVGSLTTSSTPLYVVDGIPVEARTVVSMNPDDFESVTVLKDASATSIYGSRAANGVIYIATKRGMTGEAKITLRYKSGISSIANKKFYDQFMSTDELLNFWVDSEMVDQAWADRLTTNLTNNGITQADGKLWNTNWNDYIQQKNRPMSQLDFAVSGGTKALSYYVSAGQSHEAGTTIGAFFDRLTLKSTINAQVKEWMQLGVNINVGQDKRRTNGNWGGTYTSGGLSYLLQPFYSPYDKAGNEPSVVPGMGMNNPYYTNEKSWGQTTTNSLSGNLSILIEPIKDLKFVSKVGMDKYSGLTKEERLASYSSSLYNGRKQLQLGDNTNLILTNTLEYSFAIQDKHKISLLAGQEGQDMAYEMFYASVTGLEDDRMMQLDQGKKETRDIAEGTSYSRSLSFFGRGEYSFDNRYFFDASVRNDASSRFGPGNQSATFWAVGGMWNLKNENFMKDISMVDDLKLRVSYGTQGNSAIGDYSSRALVGATDFYQLNPSTMIVEPGNNDLKWETQKKLTIAVDAVLWQKLTIGLEYYNRVTKDMLMNVPVPYTSGFETILKNVGSMENNGVDINLTYHALKGSDYYLTLGAVFNYNKEKITSLFDGKDSWIIQNTGLAYIVGESVMFYFPQYAGVNPDNGNMQWYLPGDDPNVTNTDPNNVTEDFDEARLNQNLGVKRFAPINGGFNIDAGWKGISLRADFAYSLGRSLFSNDRYFSENPGAFFGYNTSKNVLDYWKQPGDHTEYPRWAEGAQMQFDSHLIEDASFMRMKNLTISYNIPKSIMGYTKVISGAKVFVTGRNLLTITKFSGIDPEPDRNLAMGLPMNTKQYMFGIELNF